MNFVNYKLLLNPAFAIGVEANGVEYDLHNFADFDGFRYSADSSTAELIWRLTRYEDVDRNGGSWLCLAFRGAYYFEVRPRDAEMPLGEDTCLDSISFVGTDEDLQALPYNEIPCLIPGRDNIDSSSHLLFRFHGGQRIRIGSEETEFMIMA